MDRRLKIRLTLTVHLTRDRDVAPPDPERDTQLDALVDRQFDNPDAPGIGFHTFGPDGDDETPPSRPLGAP